eukprot:TRINITY_DN95572_c0_g1_i1.p1 TRINITY_DN95572_c0_g1~~TRINITY_DN95572_c0_g1_i1.p1  ORF type:complete len:317 (+),score=76.80 TRINITY_DN95572_c0_g1_i1:38-988(+)
MSTQASRAPPIRGRGSESLNSQLADKEYRELVQDLIKTTAARASDFDARALALLDALQKNGTVKAAVTHVKQALDGVTRDRVGNWRRYVYSLLRGYDEDAYSSMKAEKGEKNKRVEKKPAAEGAENGAASSSKVYAKTTVLKADAGDFVPTALQPVVDGRRELRPVAAEFVPGQPIHGVGAASDGQGPGGSRLLATAPEFVPGQAADKTVLTPGAEEFVPGRPWGGAGQAAGPSTKSSKKKKNAGGTAEKAHVAPSPSPKTLSNGGHVAAPVQAPASEDRGGPGGLSGAKAWIGGAIAAAAVAVVVVRLYNKRHLK